MPFLHAIIFYLVYPKIKFLKNFATEPIKEYYPWRYIQFLLFFQQFLQDQSIDIDALKRFKNPPNPEKYLDFLDKGIFYLFLGFYISLLLMIIYMNFYNMLEKLPYYKVEFHCGP